MISVHFLNPDGEEIECVDHSQRGWTVLTQNILSTFEGTSISYIRFPSACREILECCQLAMYVP